MNRVVLILIVLILALALADSVYLAVRDIGITNNATVAACPLRGACDLVLQAGENSFFGVPAGIIGSLYFAALLGAAIVRVVTGRWLLPLLMMVGFLLGLAYSGYLVHRMVAVLHAICPYCMAAHILNALAFILVVVSLYKARQPLLARH